ncbi:MAG: oxidoreductase [Ignavibacteria bacterium]|nr:oxidoreductase [Ignavibacteria bacterium]
MKITPWNSDQITDQNNKKVIVTGASSGIGLEAAKVLAGKNAQVILAVRNSQKGEDAKKRILQVFPRADVTVMEIDLSNLKSIKAFAKSFAAQHSRLDILINNAGVMAPPPSRTTDGFELQIGTNHFGHFALTGLLMPVIAATPDSSIVNLSSMAHKMGNIDFTDINWEKRKYKKWNAYGDSKIANLYFTYELDRRLKKNAIDTKAVAAHPGYTDTDLQRHTSFFTFLNKILAQSIPMGVLPTLYAATHPNIPSGSFAGPLSMGGWRGYPGVVSSNALSYDKNNANKLWEISEKLTGITYLG